MSSSEKLTFKVDLEDGSITWSNGVSKTKSQFVTLTDDHKGLRFVQGVAPRICKWRSYKDLFGNIQGRKRYLGQSVTICTALAELPGELCKRHKEKSK